MFRSDSLDIVFQRVGLSGPWDNLGSAIDRRVALAATIGTSSPRTPGRSTREASTSGWDRNVYVTIPADVSELIASEAHNLGFSGLLGGRPGSATGRWVHTPGFIILHSSDGTFWTGKLLEDIASWIELD